MALVFRCILPEWKQVENPNLPKVVEGEFTEEETSNYNSQGYNIYFLPNGPTDYTPGVPVDGAHIDKFDYVFVDMDLKDGVYTDKNQFIAAAKSFLTPTFIVDSGNGVHAYWRVSDLDAMSYLKFQRRLTRKLNTDEAVGKIYQLMRAPGSINTKYKEEPKMCNYVFESHNVYTSEQIDKLLPPLSYKDEQFCKQHYAKTYNLQDLVKKVDDTLPAKFSQLVKSNEEVRKIWAGDISVDRSTADFRLGHVLFASGFTREEATSVLVNVPKALSRSPAHRINYAVNIIDKIWTFEVAENKDELLLSSSVRDILQRSAGGTLKGTRFPCWDYLDGTEHGFRLGQVVGLVAGSGVGKTAVALNMFMGFVQNNPDYEHFFIPLEQPANEIADRWQTMCGDRQYLYDKVHVISNYDSEGQFRHLSFTDIREYLLKFQKVTGKKIGCVVIDHIGALKKKGKDGENQDLMDICHSMKAFAIETNTLLVMQSQAPRQKAGIGDLELDKDAAYGTMYFEAYCDYLITMHQPLKRCYSEGAPTVTAFKFCKIRHKKQGYDRIKEDVCYKLFFDPQTGFLRDLTEEENKSFKFFLSKATNKRKQDRTTDLVEYQSVAVTENAQNNKTR